MTSSGDGAELTVGGVRVQDMSVRELLEAVCNLPISAGAVGPGRAVALEGGVGTPTLVRQAKDPITKDPITDDGAPRVISLVKPNPAVEMGVLSYPTVAVGNYFDQYRREVSVLVTEAECDPPDEAEGTVTAALAAARMLRAAPGFADFNLMIKPPQVFGLPGQGACASQVIDAWAMEVPSIVHAYCWPLLTSELAAKAVGLSLTQSVVAYIPRFSVGSVPIGHDGREVFPGVFTFFWKPYRIGQLDRLMAMVCGAYEPDGLCYLNLVVAHGRDRARAVLGKWPSAAHVFAWFERNPLWFQPQRCLVYPTDVKTLHCVRAAWAPEFQTAAEIRRWVDLKFGDAAWLMGGHRLKSKHVHDVNTLRRFASGHAGCCRSDSVQATAGVRDCGYSYLRAVSPVWRVSAARELGRLPRVSGFLGWLLCNPGKLEKCVGVVRVSACALSIVYAPEPHHGLRSFLSAVLLVARWPEEDHVIGA